MFNRVYKLESLIRSLKLGNFLTQPKKKNTFLLSPFFLFLRSTLTNKYKVSAQAILLVGTYFTQTSVTCLLSRFNYLHGTLHVSCPFEETWKALKSKLREERDGEEIEISSMIRRETWLGYWWGTKFPI